MCMGDRRVRVNSDFREERIEQSGPNDEDVSPTNGDKITKGLIAGIRKHS